MSSYQQFPAGPDPFTPVTYVPGPYAPAPKSNTVDIIATSMLIATHAGAYLLIAFFSLFWVMGTDSCGYQTCNYDYLTYAYVLTDVVGGIVLLVTSITAIVLMVRKHVAFWVPLLGGAVQFVLLVISLGLLGNVTN